jgi:hypothetical protein
MYYVPFMISLSNTKTSKPRNAALVAIAIILPILLMGCSSGEPKQDTSSDIPEINLEVGKDIYTQGLEQALEDLDLIE